MASFRAYMGWGPTDILMMRPPDGGGTLQVLEARRPKGEGHHTQRDLEGTRYQNTVLLCQKPPWNTLFYPHFTLFEASVVPKTRKYPWNSS